MAGRAPTVTCWAVGARMAVTVLLIFAAPLSKGEDSRLPGAWKKDITVSVSWLASAASNPFYVGLPFDDLAHPDLAKKWVPPYWHRSNLPDKEPLSTCKDRWIEIENKNGQRCFAQWLGVSQHRSDDAEYVFGDANPKDAIGMQISGRVAQQLDLLNHPGGIKWRFVDDKEVASGPWLPYDAKNLILDAFRKLKQERANSPPTNTPGQPAPPSSEPASH
jgi:hypothetical protein